MEPIVNPWFIYLLFQIDGILMSFIGISICIIILIGIAWLFYWGTDSLENYEDEIAEKFKKKLLKATKVFVPISIIVLFCCPFVPDRNTLIALYVSQSLTQNRVEEIINTSANVRETIKKDIIDIIQGVVKEKDVEEK
jgi:nitrogen fixation-related uncharacterized protein